MSNESISDAIISSRDDRRRLKLDFLRIGVGICIVALYWSSLSLVDFDLSRLIEGTPRMVSWAARAWPPDIKGLDLLLLRAAETVAMALVGTTIGVIIAAPLCVLASRNLNPFTGLYVAARWIQNVLRGIDSFIFAILFVVAVGLGPFAGVLGVSVHTAGVIAKLWSEAIEGVDRGPLDAAALTGATRLKVMSYALLPDIMPSLTSVALYALELNIRSSTVLGLVGAGGIGQELKNSVDLLFFPRILTILVIILIMVTVVDQLSAMIRRRMI
ncbi:phosphonate transport system permease protein [Nitrobacteraceae bacterium AZCC 1564]